MSEINFSGVGKYVKWVISNTFKWLFKIYEIGIYEIHETYFNVFVKLFIQCAKLMFVKYN